MNELQIQSLQFKDRGPYDLRIGPGECTCITGASGAGKTLLLRSVADLDAHQGSVSLGGVESKDLKPFEWRRRVGMLPVESKWWLERVKEHFFETDTDHLEQLGFTPEVMDKEVRELSTGERQRLAIIRLLSNKPKALLLDEPTSNLDADNVSRAETLIKSYSQTEQVPVLWVSHDLNQVDRVADKHLILDCKQLTEVKP